MSSGPLAVMQARVLRRVGLVILGIAILAFFFARLNAAVTVVPWQEASRARLVAQWSYASAGLFVLSVLMLVVSLIPRRRVG